MHANEESVICNRIVEQSPVAIAVHELVYDDAGLPVDYRFLWVNEAFGRHTGLDVRCINGRTVREVLPGIEETDFVERFADVVKTGRTAHFESYSKPLDRYYAIDAFKVGDHAFAAMFTDVSERRRAVAARDALEARNQSILKASLDHFFVTDGRGVILDVQTGKPEALIAPPDKVIGKSLADFLGPDISPRLIRGLAEAQRTGNLHVVAYDLDMPTGKQAFEARITRMDETRLLSVVRNITTEVERAREIEKAKELYQLLVENQNDLIVKVDREGLFEFVSPSYCHLFGKREEELLGRSFMPLVHEDDRAHTARAMEQLYAPPYSCHIEQRAMTVNGWRWITWSDKAVLDEHGAVAGVVGIGRDITAEKEAVLERQAMAAQLETAQQIANIGSWEYKAGGNELRWSTQTYRIFGVDTGSFDNTYEAFLSLVHEKDRERITAEYARSQEDADVPYNTEHRIIRADNGEMRWVHEQCHHERDASGRVVRSVGVVMDITERHQADYERKRLLAALEQAAEGILLTDADGRIEYVNKAFERMSGYCRNDVVGQTPRVLQSGRHDTAFYRELWRTIAGGMVWQGRIVNRRKNGEVYTAETSIAPVYDNNSQLAHFVTAQRDITEQLNKEAQLLQAQKMDTMARLAGGVAHDFNNILQVILGAAGLMKMNESGDATMREDLDAIVDAAERAKDITRQLLTFARKQPVREEQQDLNQVLTRMNKMLLRLIGLDIKLAWQPGAHLWPVWMDHGHLNQLIVNLCVNARDAMPEGGTITLQTRNCPDHGGPGLQVPHALPGDYVCIAVSDTGHGMDEATMAKVWDPFFTTKDPDRGTGLGLATVQSIVRHAGGFADIESAPGKGTTFLIYLPRFVAGTQADGKVHPHVERPGRSEVILLVDDDVAVLNQVEHMLSRRGYQVHAVQGPKDAIAWLENRNRPPDLVITDLLMPVMHGVELAEVIRKKDPSLKVLFISGQIPEALIPRVMYRNGAFFLQKPFSSNELSEKLWALLESAPS